ncbi:MAG: PEP-CTERM sorting domain-containing protein [Candidatus Solibacter usitatus]|nr:PEP-CTERM sorting domain-containing protein [Candidatus Solibacter usitatus]
MRNYLGRSVYLVLNCDCQGAGESRLYWWTTYPPTIVTDAGVSLLSDYSVHNPTPYPPAGDLTQLTRNDRLGFAVTGTAQVGQVPEPGTLSLLGAGVVLLGFLRRGVR